MAEPQRGQLVQVPPQVVPQEEQVEQPLPVPSVLVQPFAQPTAAVPLLFAQHPPADWGKSGREKNSSQTFSANSSLGGIWQKP